MKHILAILIVALVPTSVWAQSAPTLGQIASSSASSLDNVSFGTLPTVGCFMTVFLGSNTLETGATLLVADNQGNTYTRRQFKSGTSTFNMAGFTAPITTSSGTFTIDVDGGTGANETINGWVAAGEVCGQDSSPIDVTAEIEDGGPGTSATVDLATTTFSHDFIWAACGFSGSTTITSGGSYTTDAENEGDSRSFSLAHRIVTATGDYDPSWTMGTSRFYECEAIALKGTGGGGGGGGTPSRLMIGVGVR